MRSSILDSSSSSSDEESTLDGSTLGDTPLDSPASSTVPSPVIWGGGANTQFNTQDSVLLTRSSEGRPPSARKKSSTPSTTKPPRSAAKRSPPNTLQAENSTKRTKPSPMSPSEEDRVAPPLSEAKSTTLNARTESTTRSDKQQEQSKTPFAREPAKPVSAKKTPVNQDDPVEHMLRTKKAYTTASLRKELPHVRLPELLASGRIEHRVLVQGDKKLDLYWARGVKPPATPRGWTVQGSSAVKKGTAGASAAKNEVKAEANKTEQVPKKQAPDASKPKKKKLSFEEQLLRHLWCQPSTVKSLAAALKTTETAVEFTLLSLKDKGSVKFKEFPKRTLYWAADRPTTSVEERQRVEREFLAKQKEREALQQALSGLSSELSNEELKSQLDAYRKQVESLKEQVAAARARIQVSSQSQLPRPNPVQLARRFNHMRSEWKKRKDKCMDFVETLADGMEKKPKQVVQLLDLEEDEVELPAKKAVD